MTMRTIPTSLDGCILIEFNRNEDSRGWFQRAFGTVELETLGLDLAPAQVNLAFTHRAGTVRGLHLQVAPYGEDKLVHCVKGRIFDVAVDLREESETFGKWFGVELSEDSPRALLIPKGFGHGYMSLTDDVTIAYVVSQTYRPEAERAISPMHSSLAIEWPLEVSVISEKDSSAPAEGELPRSGY